MKLCIVTIFIRCLCLTYAIEIKTRAQPEADRWSDADQPSKAKWVAAFGNLAPYGDDVHVEMAYQPPDPLKTLYAESDFAGFNNARMGWEMGICYAYKTGRVYRVPKLRQFDHDHHQFAAQSSQFKSGLPDNIFAIYDERSFKMVIPSILASDPLPSKEAEFEPEKQFRILPPDNFSQKNLAYRASYEPGKRTFWQYAADKHLLPHGKYVHLIESALRLKWGLLRHAAARLEKHGLEPGGYVALHRRMGDFLGAEWYRKRHDNTDAAVAEHVKPIVQGRPVLVLAEPGTISPDFLEKLTTIAGASRVVCWANETFTGPELAFGPQLDMLSAVPASKFIGSPISTFSYGIVRWRVQAGTHKKGSPLFWTSKIGVGGENTWNGPGAPGTYMLNLEGLKPSHRASQSFDRELAWRMMSWFTSEMME